MWYGSTVRSVAVPSAVRRDDILTERWVSRAVTTVDQIFSLIDLAAGLTKLKRENTISGGKGRRSGIASVIFLSTCWRCRARGVFRKGASAHWANSSAL